MRKRTVVAAWLLLACLPSVPDETDTPTPTPVATGPELASATDEGWEAFWSVAIGREVYPTRAIGEQSEIGAWHYRVRHEQGRVTRLQYVAPSGRIVEDVHFEYTLGGRRIQRHHDARGVLARTETWYANGRHTHALRSGVTNSDGCVLLQHDFDPDGNVIQTTCLGSAGTPIVSNDGCQISRFEHGVDRDLAVYSCFDDQDRPVLDATGVHLVRYQRDGRGQQVSEAYFDTRRRSIRRSSDGCAGWRFERDRRGNAIWYHCQDEDGEPVALRGQPYSIVEDEFDERDCLVARRFRDAQGAHSSWGNVREIRRVCNDWCEPIVERHLDRTGSPTKPGLYSPAITESTYDAEGLVTRRVCTDGPDNPVDCWFGEPHDEGSLVTITYDDKGRQQSQKGFTSVGVPSRIARNYPHEVRYEYGANGRLAAKSFFDEAGAPALGLGVARMEFEYDAAGSMTVERSLGIEAGLARPVTGCATIRTDYDAKHRTSVLECLGPDLRPAESDLIYRGVAWEGHASKVVVERDERGTARANVYFSPDGDEVGRVDCAGLKAYCYR